MFWGKTKFCIISKSDGFCYNAIGLVITEVHINSKKSKDIQCREKHGKSARNFKGWIELTVSSIANKENTIANMLD